MKHVIRVSFISLIILTALAVKPTYAMDSTSCTWTGNTKNCITNHYNDNTGYVETNQHIEYGANKPNNNIDPSTPEDPYKLYGQ